MSLLAPTNSDKVVKTETPTILQSSICHLTQITLAQYINQRIM